MKNNQIAIILLIVTAFAAGYALRSPHSLSKTGRAVLYYTDPMHPSYRSDTPGTAPDCGMELEPVYADENGQGAFPERERTAVPGAIRISSDRQQLIGVQVAEVEKKRFARTVRLLGKVAVNETRIFRINATVDGWITRTYPNATGSLVKKNDVLAGFYSPDFLSAQQAYLFALSSQDRITAQPSENPGRGAQLEQFTINLKQYRDALMNLGMGPIQVDEISRTRQYAETIAIASPADGVILARSVSQGQRFEKGTELYRLADLSTVWVLADVFEGEAAFIRPGAAGRVNVPGQTRTYSAVVSDALPQFDPVTRTLKLRLEVRNPGLALKPDMFVDVDLPAADRAAVVIPIDAVLDTGLKKTVFVDLGNGYFEPRRVETGLRGNGEVEITGGLTPKERIVVSGAFLVDSESRMRSAATGAVADPVCRHTVDPVKARAAGRMSGSGAQVSYFCSRECKEVFDREAADPASAAVKKISATVSAGRHHD